MHVFFGSWGPDGQFSQLWSPDHRLQLSVIDYFRSPSDLLLIGYITDFKSNIRSRYFKIVGVLAQSFNSTQACLCVSGEKGRSVAADVNKRVEQGMKMDDSAVYQGQHLLDRHETRVDGVFNYAYVKLIYKKNYAFNASIVFH